MTVECRFEAFSSKTTETLSHRLAPYGCETSPDKGIPSPPTTTAGTKAEAYIHGSGVHPFLYSDSVVSNDHGTQVVRHDFWAHKIGSVWMGAALDSSVAAESALRWITAIELLEHGGLLLHASSAIVDGQGHLFLGGSGAGKSTLVAEGDFDSVLCDEISVVARNGDGGYRLWPSPFWGIGSVGEVCEAAPLSAVWVLFGWEKTAAAKVDLTDAVLAVYRRVVDVGAAAFPPKKVLDIAAELAEQVPVHRLSWRRGAPLRDLLQQGESKNGSL